MTPGIDGKPDGFYQSFWETVGKDTCEVVLHFLNSGHLLKEFNRTLIALVPKKSGPKKVADYRTISLCNVIYKIGSKVLVNKIRNLLDKVIPKRLISDNVILAFKILDTIKKKNKGKGSLVALKLDLSKAYDRLSWDFLQCTLQEMNFPSHWIQLIRECISTISYKVIINVGLSKLWRSTIKRTKAR